MTQLIEGADPVLIQGSGKNPYKLKSVGGVYSCDCPAWRNQASTPIERRTCKHLRSYCGSAAEDARIGKATSESIVLPVLEGESERAVKERAKMAELGRKLRPDEKVAVHGPPILLAHKFEDAEVDPTGWWWSEKLDGVRAVWDGKNFISRGGNVYHAPAWFKKGLPPVKLDGELWMGRGQFQKTVAVVKRQDGSEHWKVLTYCVFDMLDVEAPFEARLGLLHALGYGAYGRLLPQGKVKNLEHLVGLLEEIARGGGEGLMIRQPGSPYEVGRSTTLLKVKPFSDAEAIVVGYEAGKGSNKGVTGGLILEMPNKKTFHIGTLTAKMRRKPPPVGAQVTYRYTGATDDGLPKCTSLVGVRDYE